MRGRAIIYSEAELAWIKANSKMLRSDLHAAFCKRFDRQDVSQANLTALCKRRGWLTGRTGRFAKGMVPANKGKKMPYNDNSARTQFKSGNRSGMAERLYKPIGTERLSKDGYWERKIHDGMPLQSRWRAVHLVRWEELNGPVPEGHCLKCIDGDRANTDPLNWMAIPRALLPRLNGRWGGLNYDNAEPELRPYLLAAAKLKQAARDRQAEGAA